MIKPDISRLFKEDINTFLPLIQELMHHQISDQLLQKRFEAMFTQNYECFGVFDKDKLIGVFGLWFATRHYCGKTCEPDHVYLLPEYRSKGMGKKVFEWIFNYAREQSCETSELNSYVNNYPSHKFYLNQGYEIWAHHFLKKL